MHQKTQGRKYFSPINNSTLFSNSFLLSWKQKKPHPSMTCLKKQQRGFGISYQGEKWWEILQVTKVCRQTRLALSEVQSKQAACDPHISNPPHTEIALPPTRECHQHSHTPPARNQLFRHSLNNELWLFSSFFFPFLFEMWFWLLKRACVQDGNRWGLLVALRCHTCPWPGALPAHWKRHWELEQGPAGSCVILQILLI